MSDYQWHDVRALGPRGVGFDDRAHPYDRLPARAETELPEHVWRLSRQSTGMYVDFGTDATELHAHTVLRVPPNEACLWAKYLDLYVRDAQRRWRWAGVSTNGFIPSGQTPLITGLPEARRTFRLYLPLTFSVERLSLALPQGATLEPAPAPGHGPVVIYGTSVVHGSSAARPGMVFPSILGRWLDREVINLGFSGSGKMHPPLAGMLGQIAASLLVIDPLPNMSADLVRERAEPFLRELLDARPNTPILMVEDRVHAHHWMLPGPQRQREEKRAAWREIYERLKGENPCRLAYLGGDGLLGADGDDTIDGSHPTDLGYQRMAAAHAPVWRELLNEGAEQSGQMVQQEGGV